MNAFDGLKVLAEAHAYLRAAAVGVPDASWGAATPCTEWTVRQVLNHARLDQQALIMQINPEAAPTADPFSPVDELADDAIAQLDAVLGQSAAAWGSVDPAAQDVPTPMGPMPTQLGAAVAALDAAVHAWDIAKATGQDLPLTDELADGLDAAAQRTVDFVRDNFGKYGPVVPVPEGSGSADKLLAFTGRDPRWAPAG
ncbi:TIGR03086 family metal-binding protein [Streptomycetaceae bacterium NBC_01309]